MPSKMTDDRKKIDVVRLDSVIGKLGKKAEKQPTVFNLKIVK